MILRKTCPLIAGVLENSKGYISGEYLLIDTDNSQFRALVNGQNASYRNSIRNAAKEVFGKTFKLGPYKKAEQTKNSSRKQTVLLQTISSCGAFDDVCSKGISCGSVTGGVDCHRDFEDKKRK